MVAKVYPRSWERLRPNQTGFDHVRLGDPNDPARSML